MVEQYTLQNLPQHQKEEIDAGIIVVGTTPDVKTFPVDNLILNRSTYFKKLFSVPDSENNVHSVTISEFSPKIFDVIYR